MEHKELLYLAEKKSLHWSLEVVDSEEDDAVAAATGRPVEGGGGRRPPVEVSPVSQTRNKSEKESL